MRMTGKQKEKGGTADASYTNAPKMTSSEGVNNKWSKDGVGLGTIVTETVLGYVFWSLLQGLGPMIWFYPLNELEISGYEVFVVAWFSPLLTSIPGMLTLVQNRWVLGVLRVTSLACLGSFQAPDTLTRLAVLALGVGTSMVILTASLWSPHPKTRYQTYWGLILGLVTLVSSRIWLTSFIPTWWSPTSNAAVIAIGAIATITKIMTEESKSSPETIKSSVSPYWLPTAMGFGSLLFLTHWCFGEVSLITRWVVRGYPETGPSPNPWGAAVLVAITLGVYLSWSKLPTSIVWWAIGICNLACLYYLPTWQGFVGGLILAVFTFSLWPDMTERLTQCPPARTLFVAMVTYLVEIFFFVWTVAFNFVPGGEYTREHTDYLIACIGVCLLLGLFTSGRKDGYCLFTSEDEGGTSLGSSKVIKSVLLSLMLIGLSGFVFRYDPHRIQHPVKKDPKVFTAAIWTYHFGYDNRGWPSLERSAELLNDTGADFITLLESDASKPFLGNNDLGMWLGERLGMYVEFGPATKDHTWGNLILSKYPIVKSTHHLLPSPKGELAPAITATVNYSGSLVDFVVTHMGNDRDVLDRELQSKFLSQQLKNCSNPAVFLGYVTSAPGSASYLQLISHGGVKDIDHTDQDRWCEYIMYKKLIRIGYARITHGGLSDTEVQVAKFQIPTDPSHYKDNDKVVTKAKNIQKEHRFNKKFGSFHSGHGYFEGHNFHMSTPKYFLP